MDMNERKVRILEAIIRDYIQTGDPVGSRTISKKYDLGISSATIRNEMADLEELGFIMQPHTSAGRIPSDKGYRLYVDNLMQRTRLQPEMERIIVEMIKEKVTRMDTLIEETAKLISMLTNYATIASTPTMSQTKVKHLQLVPVDERSVACVIVTDTNSVKNHILRTPKALDMNLCTVLSNILNDSLKGVTLSEISLDKIRLSIEEKLREYSGIAESILGAIHHILKEEAIPDVFIRGATNILDFQEFTDKDKTREIFKLLEEKPYLMELLDNSPSNQVNIRIGEENIFTPMKDCSIVTTSYTIGPYTLGNIGIIGPTRMDYGQVVSVLEYVSHYITSMLSSLNDS
ncbi:HrcA family transcriptional regulator [Sporanaerobium hydrogeniformans]|uniref:HrcA family transcriptional regulator n=1 Tax=Sporanaerobium hydrogeniformans TaxID=3072179 RepID=A0AC61DFP9_9FIRM|nr:heat-inducible transcriptional repressor HrcA [Sporanaerobium hydrogeniformans]PHV71511.1 HrcA family transcriptional regulator [Sporanaerobium hydrogeniformans]